MIFLLMIICCCLCPHQPIQLGAAAQAVPWCTSQPNRARGQCIGLRAGSQPRLPFRPGSLVSLQGVFIFMYTMFMVTKLSSSIHLSTHLNDFDWECEIYSNALRSRLCSWFEWNFQKILTWRIPREHNVGWNNRDWVENSDLLFAGYLLEDKWDNNYAGKKL